MKILLLVTIAFIVMALAAPAFAGTQDNAVVALHQQPLVQKAITICSSSSPNAAGIPCSNYSTNNAPNNSSRDVYLVVARGNTTTGIAGLSCGIIQTGGTAVFGWTLCADLDFPNSGWPGSGGGDRITWAAISNCQDGTTAGAILGGDGIHAIAGSFYVYSYYDGTISVTPNNGVPIPEFAVADCSASESDIGIPGGSVGFGSLTGFNPCTAVVPVEETTWGSIKNKFGS